MVSSLKELIDEPELTGIDDPEKGSQLAGELAAVRSPC
jgi:hypothetical protein